MSDILKPCSLRHILVYTDFSESADHAFAEAVRHRFQHADARLTLLHVVPEPEAQFWNTYLYENDDVDNKAHADMTARIKQTYRAQLPEDIALEVMLRAGSPREIIPEVARQIGADMLVIGIEAHGLFANLFLSGDTRAILRNAPCPVLLTKREPRG